MNKREQRVCVCVVCDEQRKGDRDEWTEHGQCFVGLFACVCVCEDLLQQQLWCVCVCVCFPEMRRVDGLVSARAASWRVACVWL